MKNNWILITIKRALKDGYNRCKKEKNLDECSFGYETGVLITGNDAKYLLSVIEKSSHVEALEAENELLKNNLLDALAEVEALRKEKSDL